MGLFDKKRSDGQTFDGQGDSRKGFIDNVFVNLEKGCLQSFEETEYYS